MNARSETEAFARLISAVEPWLGEIVIVGGWAHRLYRLHPSAQTLDYTPLATFDADLAIPARLSRRDQDIRERLFTAGFSEERLGADKPPATHYQLSEPGTDFFAESLTPLKGSEYSRHGQRKATKRIGGVVTQQLRHLEVLLQKPWSIDLDNLKVSRYRAAARFRWLTRRPSWRISFSFIAPAVALILRKTFYTSTTRCKPSARGCRTCAANGNGSYGLTFTSAPRTGSKPA
ncbi:MAG TPA: GSU2403 family nucleotidyltransferase fold protein [Terriglobia bacterium]|nr:GSU2403 family nucleotidyltransferase fold protein [Terriglobia bacterium]